jgi:hypothetical protein
MARSIGDSRDTRRPISGGAAIRSALEEGKSVHDIAKNRLEAKKPVSQLKEQIKLAVKLFEKSRSENQTDQKFLYNAILRQLRIKIAEVMNLDSRESNVKVAGRDRFVAVVEVIQDAMTEIPTDHKRTRLAILGALRQYPVNHDSVEASVAIGRVFGSEYRRMAHDSGEYEAYSEQHAAEALANIHHYPGGPVGRTNARIFEAKVQECLGDSRMARLVSSDLTEDREAAQRRRATLMDCRTQPARVQKDTINTEVNLFFSKLDDIKACDSDASIDKRTVTWQGAMRAGPKDKMSHAYVATFYAEEGQVYMTLSDSGQTGKQRLKEIFGDDFDTVNPSVFKISDTNSPAFKKLIREMARSVVKNDKTVEARSKTLLDLISKASDSDPVLPDSLTKLRHNGLKRMEGDYCVSWSHMQNMEARFTMMSQEQLVDSKAQELFADMAMLSYRNAVDESLLDMAGHEASSTLRDITYSAQYTMADEARTLLAQWDAMPEPTYREGKSEEWVKDVIKQVREFEKKYRPPELRSDGARVNVKSEHDPARHRRKEVILSHIPAAAKPGAPSLPAPTHIFPVTPAPPIAGSGA